MFAFTPEVCSLVLVLLMNALIKSEEENSAERVVIGKKRIKGIRHPKDYQSQVIKKARIAGESCISWKGKHILEVAIGSDCGQVAYFSPF